MPFAWAGEESRGVYVNVQAGRRCTTLPETEPFQGVRGSLQRGLESQRINFFQDGLKPQFQLFLCAWLFFCSHKLGVICQGAAIEVGSLIQQLYFWVDVG
jgi:hypothetical protein